MTIKSNLQEFYNIATSTTNYREGSSLTKIVFLAATPGYIGGCVVKWLRPTTPILPLGCAVSTIYMIPISCGCGFIAWKVASLINKN